MEHDLVLEGRVVTPAGIQETEIGVSEGIITELGQGLKAAKKISGERCLIFPGFVDIHVHLREPGWEHKEDFRTGTMAAVHGGVTTVVDMPNNPIPTTTKTALDLKRRLADYRSLVDVRFHGGVTRGNLNHLSEMAEGVVGYKVYLSETTGAIGFPDAELRQAFQVISNTKRPVSLHCEDQAVIDRRRTELHGLQGPDANCELRPPEAELESVEKVATAMRDVEDVRANVCHASTKETLSIIRKARSEKLKLYCEATLHHLFYNRRTLLENRLLKTNPPLRSEEDRQALVGGLKDGTVSFLVTDHAPHTEEEKADKNPAGVPGLDDYGHVVSWLIREQAVDPAVITKVSASNPAKHLRLDDRGEISVGKRADFAVLDIHSPEKVRNDQIRSKCGWSPYEGREFPGRIRWTIYGGEVLLDDYELAR
jgi:dihydroorotase